MDIIINATAPLWDAETEMMVLGTLICGSHEPTLVMQTLSLECFCEQKSRDTFVAMSEIMQREGKIDILSVCDQLRLYHPESQVTPADIAGWMSMDSPINLMNAVKELHDFRIRRTLVDMVRKICRNVDIKTVPVTDIVESLQKDLDGLDTTTLHKSLKLSEVGTQLRQRMMDNLNPQLRHHGPLTGIEKIDQLAPLPESGLVILAGATSHGKSSLANLIALNSARKGMKVAIFSKEMTNEDTLSRMVSMGTKGTSSQWIMNRPLPDGELKDACDALDLLQRECSDMVLFDDNRSLQLSDVTSAIRRMHKQDHIRVAIVDYIQLLAHDAERSRFSTQEQVMGYYSRVLKNLGDKLGITVIALSQLNRNMPLVRPTNAHIRDSGQIAEASDYILIVWRPERYHGQYDAPYSMCETATTAMIIVDKNRHGATLEVLTGWRGKTTQFYNLSDEDVERLKLGRKPQLETKDVQGRLFEWED